MARLAFCLIVSALLVVSVFGQNRDIIQPKGFVLANNYLGFNLLNKLSDENEQKPTPDNLFFSPYSIAVAMAMLHQGAAGSTAKQLESCLGYQLAKLDKSDKSVLARQIQESNQAIFLPETASPAGNASKYTLKAGNALFVNKDFALLDSYKQSLKDNFLAESFQLDFANDPTAAMNQINEWCADKTNQKIKTLLSKPPSQSTKLALLNAVYFKGSWKLKFDSNKTKAATFTGPKGIKYDNVKFMHIKDNYKVAHLEELNADMVELPYESDELSMYAILPVDPNSDLSQVRKSLSPWYLESSISRAYSTKIKLKFPKLDFKTDYDLVGTLKALGITEVFDGDKSDLSGLTGTAGRLAVDQVKHKATIEVNEEGSEAAAATYIGIVLLSARVPFEEPLYAFDRPFVFVIRHNKNGQILFVGEVNKF